MQPIVWGRLPVLSQSTMQVFDCDDEKDLSVPAIRAMYEDVPELRGGMCVF